VALGERALAEVADDGVRAPSATEDRIDGAAGVSHRSPEERVPCGMRAVTPVPPRHACRDAAKAYRAEEPVDGDAAERHRAPKKRAGGSALRAPTLRRPRHLRSLLVLGRS
jgi:rRNA maturation protein Nop10